MNLKLFREVSIEHHIIRIVRFEKLKKGSHLERKCVQKKIFPKEYKS